MTGVGIELSQTLVWTAKKKEETKENLSRFGRLTTIGFDCYVLSEVCRGERVCWMLFKI